MPARSTGGTKRPVHRGHIRAASSAAIELLESRQLLTAVVVAPTTAPTVSGTSPLAPVADKTFWVNGLGTANAWQWNSAITPVTTNDLVLNVAPFASLYTACCEGGNSAPGSTSQAGQLLTNGLTQNQVGAFPSSGAVPATGSGQISDSSSGENVLSDLVDQPWWFEYNLGGQPGATPSANGYDITEIDVITGHQDFRTGQNTDIQVQFVGGSDWVSLSNGQNFNFNQDQNGSNLDRGAAQMAVVNSSGGVIASNIKAVKFVASNSNTWYRELVVTGSASSTFPTSGPSAAQSLSAINDQNNLNNLDVTWHNGATGSANNPSEYQIQRASVVNGVVGSFSAIGSTLGVAVGANATFVDAGPLAGAYVYKVVAFNSFNGGTFATSAQSNTVTIHIAPTVVSINRTTPAGPFTGSSSVTYTVTFNESVTGVDPTDFALALTGTVTATTPVVVGGSGAVYTVTVSGISGSGTLGLNLVDNGTIHDLSQTITLQNQQVLPAGPHPRAMVSADVNGDGKPDLVTANFTGNSVSVLLSNGNGTFQSPRTFAVGANQSYAMSVALTDVNGDGKKDIVVANGIGGTVSVLLGNGDGTFAPQRTFAAGPNPYCVSVLDVSGDGKPDIIVANNDLSGTVGVLLGNGNGIFQTQRTFAVGSYPRSAIAADVNGDGKPDLVVANYASSTISVLLGNANGTFGAQATFSSGAYPQSVIVADVNGDSKQDLIVTNYSSNAVSVLLGNGNGTFQGRRVTSTGGGPFAVTVADINADGKQDLVVANDAAGSVGLFLGNANGTFQAQQTFDVGANPLAVTVADFNADGRPDIAAANFNDGTVSLLLQASTLNFTGQIYNIAPLLDTINGSTGVDQVTLVQDADAQHIDWTLNNSAGTSYGQLFITDASGLTINGGGASDIVTLINTPGNPLPNLLNLNGTFTVNGLSGSNPLSGQKWNINRSTVYIAYTSFDPLAAIQTYLKNGYNNGAWNGAVTAGTGVITSTPAAQNVAQTTAIGYADSADGLIAGQPVNTIELKYTLYGDTSLSGSAGFNDFTRLIQHYNQTTGGAWDSGDFNYDNSVNLADFTILTRTYNTSLGNQAVPATSAVGSATDPAPPLDLTSPRTGHSKTTKKKR